ncbi:lysine decarboxylase [Naegleria gruberi]|uniref:Lysine decarboxylase n=1 Tax=Naegleria gruberi TaxID=5762 RepID=D2V6A9_NAEGR|nr:lysine decarboxylase [Naegleria gruberi]EFC47415.1 lysine decarboxylase [Naegleria gruberi]|eukprot:XP_002680159.1 lysine decarboxylase [Naegleria gruberi strain NEG-M]
MSSQPTNSTCSSDCSASTVAAEKPKLSFVVYCASSSKLDEKYFSAATQVGETCAQNGIGVRYGGGNCGLMGTVAKSCMDKGGYVVGVIPKFMVDKQWGMERNFISELVITETMHERKAKMIEDTDACVALPGGVGTFEELLEVITWKKLGIYCKPIIIVNVDGYYDPLIQLFNNAVNEKFMNPKHLDLFSVVSKGEDVVKAFETAVPWDKNNIEFISELL